MRTWLLAIPASLLVACGAASDPRSVSAQAASLEASALDVAITYNVAPTHPLAHVSKWSYVLSDSTAAGKLARLVDGDDDLVVTDEARTQSDLQSYNMSGDVSKLHASFGRAGKKKIVLAYVNVGEYETGRYFAKKEWHPGSPTWITGTDPDGWGATAFPVAFWREEWKQILLRDADSVMSRVIADGFDGVYMDWVEAASFPAVVAQAAAEGVDPKAEMVKLIAELRDQARKVNPSFVIVAQNAIEMRGTPGYLDLLTGQAQEQIFFDGLANFAGTAKEQGDCRLPLRIDTPAPASNPGYCASLHTMKASSEEYVRALASYLKAGVPVLAVDYALQPTNAAFSYEQFDRFHFVGLVTMRSLEDVTATPVR